MPVTPDAPADSDASPNRPVATFKQSGVEVTIWKNSAQNGDLFNTTIRNAYKDEKSDAWKETTNFSPTDLAILAQLAGHAFQEIVRLKQQKRVKPAEVSAPARRETRHRSPQARVSTNTQG